MTPPRCLAVDCRHGSLHAGRRHGIGPQRFQPVGKAGLERGRLEHHQDTSEHILARYPVGQIEYLQKQLLLEGRPASDGCWTAGSGEHRQKRDDDHAAQRMPLIDCRAGILQFLEMGDHFIPEI